MNKTVKNRCGICHRTTRLPKWTTFTDLGMWLDSWEDADKETSQAMLRSWPYRQHGDEVQIMVCQNCLGNFLFEAIPSRANEVLEREGKGLAKAFLAFLNYWVERPCKYASEFYFTTPDHDVDSDSLQKLVGRFLGRKVSVDLLWVFRRKN